MIRISKGLMNMLRRDFFSNLLYSLFLFAPLLAALSCSVANEVNKPASPSGDAGKASPRHFVDLDKKTWFAYPAPLVGVIRKPETKGCLRVDFVNATPFTVEMLCGKRSWYYSPISPDGSFVYRNSILECELWWSAKYRPFSVWLHKTEGWVSMRRSSSKNQNWILANRSRFYGWTTWRIGPDEYYGYELPKENEWLRLGPGETMSFSWEYERPRDDVRQYDYDKETGPPVVWGSRLIATKILFLTKARLKGCADSERNVAISTGWVTYSD